MTRHKSKMYDIYLLGSRYLASHEQPEKAFGERFFAGGGSLGQFVLAFGDAVASESDAFIGV